MNRLRILPAIMPVESHAIVVQHFRRVCQDPENRLGSKRRHSPHAETPPDRAAFFHAKSEDAPSKTTARTGGSSICQALAKKL